MLKPYWMDLLIEFLRPGHSDLSATNIPPLDGPLRPNDGLHERFEPLPSQAINELWDVLPISDETLLAASGNRVVAIGTESGTIDVRASFDTPVTCLAESTGGDVLAGVSGRGVVSVATDGTISDVVTAASGVPVTCPTAVVTGPDGAVYVVDGSRSHGPEEWFKDLMERNSSGRLLRHDPGSGRTAALVDGLAFPAGVTATHDGQGLLFTTAWDHAIRLWSFADRRVSTIRRGLPGYPGKLSPAAGSGYWLAMFAMRTQLVEFVLTERRYRTEMMRTINPDSWIRPALASLNSGLEPLQGGGIRKLGVKKPWAPPRSYGMVVLLGDDGEPTSSYQSTADRDRHGIVSVRQRGGRVYAACHAKNAILSAALEVA